MRILILGFTKFNGMLYNSSEEAVKMADVKNDVYKAYLPVSYDKATDVLLDSVDKINPDMVILFGQAGNSSKIKVETRAINLMDSMSPDVFGVIKTNEKIILSGSDFISTLVNVENLVEYLKSADIDAEVSFDCGTYLCNKTYYEAMYYLNIPCVFIHLPLFTGQDFDPRYVYENIEKLVKTVELSTNFFR